MGQSVQPIRPALPIQPVLPNRPVVPIRTDLPIWPVWPNQPVQPIRPVWPIWAVRPIQPVLPTRLDRPIRPVQPTQPVWPRQLVLPSLQSKKLFFLLSSFFWKVFFLKSLFKNDLFLFPSPISQRPTGPQTHGAFTISSKPKWPFYNSSHSRGRYIRSGPCFPLTPRVREHVLISARSTIQIKMDIEFFSIGVSGVVVPGGRGLRGLEVHPVHDPVCEHHAGSSGCSHKRSGVKRMIVQ